MLGIVILEPNLPLTVISKMSGKVMMAVVVRRGGRDREREREREKERKRERDREKETER